MSSPNLEWTPTRALERDSVEVPLVVGVIVELGALTGRHRADAWVETLGLRRRQVCGDVAQVPRADASRIVVGDELRHGDDQLLAGLELLEQRVAHADGSGFMRRARGLALSSSATTAASTSSGAPGRSWIGPHTQPSR